MAVRSDAPIHCIVAGTCGDAYFTNQGKRSKYILFFGFHIQEELQWPI